MAARQVTVTLACLAGLTACSLDPVDLDGLQCPCAEGWTCVSDVCVEDGLDAGLDLAVEPDLGESDAGPPPVDGGADLGRDLGSDAGSDAGRSSICETTTAFFCDGFEDGLVPPWNSVRTVGEGTFIDDGMPFVGERSGHGVTTAPSSRAHVIASLGGRTGVRLYARAWIYLPSTSPHETLTFLLIGHDSDPTYPLVALQSTRAGARVYLAEPFRRSAAGGADAPIPRDRWVCTTLAVDVGSSTPHVRATVDGVVAGDETLSDVVVPSADFGNAGIEFTNAGTPNAELFIDEVEFGTEPLPCE